MIDATTLMPYFKWGSFGTSATCCIIIELVIRMGATLNN